MKKKEAEETDNIAEEDRRAKFVGSKSKIAAGRTRTKGRMKAKKERT